MRGLACPHPFACKLWRTPPPAPLDHRMPHELQTARRARLEAIARRAAVCAVASRGGSPLTLAEARDLRIQTASPTSRVLLLLLSLPVIVLGVWLLCAGELFAGVIVVVVGLAGCALAYGGRKRPLDTVLGAIDLVDLLGSLVDSVDL